MRHLLFNKISITLAAIALFLVAMLHDPDLAKGDAPDPGPVAHEYVPGYQFAPDTAGAQPLSDVEVAKLNSPTDGALPTF